MANAANKMTFPQDKEVLDEMERLYDEVSGTNSSDLKAFEVMVIIAWKD